MFACFGQIYSHTNFIGKNVLTQPKIALSRFYIKVSCIATPAPPASEIGPEDVISIVSRTLQMFRL